MLWVPGVADLVKGVSQCVLAVRLESNIEVDDGVVGRLTQADPVVRDGLPLVLYTHIAPIRREGSLMTSEGRSDKYREQGDGERRELAEHLYFGRWRESMAVGVEKARGPEP